MCWLTPSGGYVTTVDVASQNQPANADVLGYVLTDLRQGPKPEVAFHSYTRRGR